MSRYLVFLVLCLATVKTGFSLKCYTSNLSARPLKVKDIRHELKECKEVINDIRKNQGHSKRNITDELCCYTVIAADPQNVVLKGCFPKNGCDQLKPNFQKMIKPTPSTIHCTECEEDGCNNVTLKSVKMSDSSGAERVLINFVTSVIFIVSLIL